MDNFKCKFKRIVLESVMLEVSAETNLWRAVMVQNLNDLSSDAKYNSRLAGHRRSAFYWIFAQKLSVRKYDIKEIKEILQNINYQPSKDFSQICDLASINIRSAIRQVMDIIDAKESL